ncbi:MAG: PilT/PilU family type 4a pilus ATPase [Elusimicrobia bacterium]|nr:PilT/PilU family type 4a pilus ATPase [Elusimicrobiota bacterium]
MTLSALIKKAISQGASDIHLVTGLPPSLRVAKEILMLDGDPLSEGDIRGMIDPALNDEQRRIFEADWQLCFSTIIDGLAHTRISVYRRLGKMEATLRLRSFEIPKLEALGIPESAIELTRKPNGLVLITGPTGVGKTTTFYSMLDRINSERRVKIISVEDPIEYLHSHKRSIVIQQEIGHDVKSYHSALMHILRLDPDVICIGEMRDANTIAAALLAAETGHLVIATLHTANAAQTMERIVTAVPPEERGGATIQLANCLRGVITQLLLPTVDGKSLVLAYEVMLANAAVRSNIRENKLASINDAIQSGRSEGMCSLDMCLRDLYQSGRITYDTAASYAKNPKLIHGQGEGK